MYPSRIIVSVGGEVNSRVVSEGAGGVPIAE